MFSGGEGEYVRQTWTELLESEASRGAKRTQQGVDNVKWNGLNVIRDAVVRFVLLFWKVIKIREHALSFPLCFYMSEIASDFYELFAKWRVSTRYQGLNEVKDLPPRESAPPPGGEKRP